ncbi:MAG: hypothetical protein FJ279_05930 [Planctomycetes bacterium]|nr:hypothetical protein [Planctomycetota bacterium]
MMEQREIPPIFFTILTRGNPRFILNQAGVRPLNMFSLIYPKPAIIKGKATELLWALLNSEFSLSKLHSVSRTYGGRTLKVEPRELDNLPVVNPLLLSDGQRTALQALIAGYFAIRDVAHLTREVSRFVTSLLSQKSPHRDSPATARLRPSRLKQLTLCESPATYKRKGRITKRR